MIHIIKVMSNRKTIKIKKDKKTQECFFDLEDFSDYFDISKIKYYEIEEINKSLVLRFFDENQKPLKPLKNSGNI